MPWHASQGLAHGDGLLDPWVSGVESSLFELGIVGLGNIGKQVARLAEALGMEILFYDNDLEHLDVDGPDGAGVDNTYNINGVDLGGSGVGTTEAAGTVTIDDGQGDSTWNIQGNELSAASDHVFNGGAGDDDFTIFLTDGGEVSADSLEINGQAQDTDRDRVILDVTADTGSARGVTMTYADATKASGDLDVAGLTAAAAAEADRLAAGS
mgnify:CR=1 FL=1